VAVKIKLMRMGKKREPFYRVVVADARTKRDGRAIETIGKYHPKEDPSIITIDGDRAAYWLGVGAQPTEAVEVLLKITGDWQKFKGLPAPPAMLMAVEKTDKRLVFEAAALEAATGSAGDKAATTPKAKKAPAKKAVAVAEVPAEAPAEAPAEVPAEAVADAPAEAPADAPAEAVAEAVVEAPAEVPAEVPAEPAPSTEEA
jgi:small subunit ribosomal protein S16